MVSCILSRMPRKFCMGRLSETMLAMVMGVCITSCSDKVIQKGAVTVVIDTDMSVPTQINRLGYVVTQNGRSISSEVGAVRREGSVFFPTTIPITYCQSGEKCDTFDLTQPILVRVIGFYEEGNEPGAKRAPVVLKKALFRIPASKRVMLRMPLSWLDRGGVELGEPLQEPIAGIGDILANYMDPVGSGSTEVPVSTFIRPAGCNAQVDTRIDYGRCVDANVDTETLPEYSEAAVFGGGTLERSANGELIAKGGTCYDGTQCFAAARGEPKPIREGARCVARIPNFTAANALALKVRRTTGQGEEIVPLVDKAYQWNPSNNTIDLPETACSDEMLGLLVSSTCVPRTEDVPLCSIANVGGTASVAPSTSAPVGPGGTGIPADAGAPNGRFSQPIKIGADFQGPPVSFLAPATRGAKLVAAVSDKILGISVETGAVDVLLQGASATPPFSALTVSPDDQFYVSMVGFVRRGQVTASNPVAFHSPELTVKSMATGTDRFWWIDDTGLHNCAIAAASPYCVNEQFATSLVPRVGAKPAWVALENSAAGANAWVTTDQGEVWKCTPSPLVCSRMVDTPNGAAGQIVVSQDRAFWIDTKANQVISFPINGKPADPMTNYGSPAVQGYALPAEGSNLAIDDRYFYFERRNVQSSADEIIALEYNSTDPVKVLNAIAAVPNSNPTSRVVKGIAVGTEGAGRRFVYWIQNGSGSSSAHKSERLN